MSRLSQINRKSKVKYSSDDAISFLALLEHIKRYFSCCIPGEMFVGAGSYSNNFSTDLIFERKVVSIILIV